MNEQGMFQAITHHVASCSYWQPRGGCFSYSCCSLKGCACLKHYLFKASNTTSWGVTTRGTEGDVSPHGHRRQGGVQCRLTASTGLRLNRRHTPCSCGYDVGCCRYKKQGVYVSYFFSYIFLTWHYRKGLRALLPFGLPFMIFARKWRWQTVMYDVT